ncbi:AAA family ATPase [Nostoc sp. 'Lobaria pulmonaria (5183) cyanobiont']|uniref:AAA family ATPase n=1 Tax=Nostoc sp. 'Lobaria pulmonaria (5183) cyanobiont' TaxID=1618022 RepID=UPI000CF321DB|nr:AAA family ATPase [Nostoc sp. 'Lobaria pulmonaria (5183) cyanobiont']AVH72809.1 AAA ATPase [Nostoc sp. 'Lobaria pulmonaria (5183) cyanobiont']
MKVEIHNLGVIEELEIDLKPLTVFIGRNGTGKTWTANTLASIFGKNGFDRYFKSYIDGKTKQKYPILDNAIEQFIQEGNVSIDLINFAEEYAEAYINDVAQSSPSLIKTFMSSERSDFKSRKISFNLATVKQEILENVKKYSLEKQIYFGSQGKEYLNILKEIDENNIYFNIICKGSFLKKIPIRLFKKLLLQEIFQILHSSFYSDVYIFPIQRTTFPTFPFSLEKESLEFENVNFDNFDETSDINLDVKIISERSDKPKNKKTSEPVQSLIEILANAYINITEEREEEIQKRPEIAIYAELAELLEKQILQGRIDFNDPGLENKIFFQPSEKIKLEITVASSLVQGLTPLVLCLRYLAEPGELLIIDEPEIHLHPSVQVAITEFLAMLVQAGLKVLIITHSPYILDHLSNLMKAAQYKDKESIKDKFYLERTEAFIPQEKVSVYLFEDGMAKNILNQEGRIDWDTFGDVSDDISHIFP